MPTGCDFRTALLQIVCLAGSVPLASSQANSICELSKPIDWPWFRKIAPRRLAWSVSLVPLAKFAGGKQTCGGSSGEWPGSGTPSSLPKEGSELASRAMCRELTSSAVATWEVMSVYASELSMHYSDNWRDFMEPCAVALVLGEAYLSGGHYLARPYLYAVVRMSWLDVFDSGFPVYHWLADLMHHFIVSGDGKYEAEEFKPIEELVNDAVRLELEGLDHSGAVVAAKQPWAAACVVKAMRLLERRGVRCEMEYPLTISCARREVLTEWAAGSVATALLSLVYVSRRLRPQSAMTATDRLLIGQAHEEFVMASENDKFLHPGIIQLLAFIDKQSDHGPYDCWSGGGVSRAECCGISMDHCCSDSAGHDISVRSVCWAEGRTFERCCVDLSGDICLRDFRARLADQDKRICSDYLASGEAYNFSQCAVWTLPDAHFAETFAAPMVEQGLARCYEVEMRLPTPAALEDPYSGTKVGTENPCLVGGCPWARFGVCTPLACGLSDVRKHWKDFVGSQGGPPNRPLWCSWNDVRIHEYRTRREIVRPWAHPVSVIHVPKTGGHALKRRLFALHAAGTDDESWAMEGSPLLCQAERHIPHCPADSGKLYGFLVRDPTNRFVSHFLNAFRRKHTVAAEERAFVTFPTPEEMGTGLRHRLLAAEAWKGMLAQLSFAHHFGGLTNVETCVRHNRFVFIGRTEHMMEDAVRMYTSGLFGPTAAQMTNVTTLEDDSLLDFAAPTSQQSMKVLSGPAKDAAKAYLIEDYLIIALFIWKGYLPNSYFAEIGLRHGSTTDCSTAGALWLAHLLGISDAWWFVWHSEGRCRLAGILGLEPAKLIFSEIFKGGEHAATLLDPQGSMQEQYGNQDSFLSECFDFFNQLAPRFCSIEKEALDTPV